MPLKLACFCSYPTTIEEKWSDDDYNANGLKKALKGESLKACAAVPTTIDPAGYVPLVNSNAHLAVTIVARFCADFIGTEPTLEGAGQIRLVPIPSSSAIINTTTRRFVGLQIAQETVSMIGKPSVQVADVLRFTEASQTTRQGGTRLARDILAKLTLIGEVENGALYVLIDDVATSGGHILACEKKLRTVGASFRGRTRRSASSSSARWSVEVHRPPLNTT